jgi:flagellar hook capping protein FlgD
MKPVRPLLPLMLAAAFGIWAPAATPLPALAGDPPSIELLVAPAPGESVYYAVPFAWKGTDVDDSVAFYRFAIDPPGQGEPLWIQTTRTRQTFLFTARMPQSPIPGSGVIRFYEPHTFEVEAVDQSGQPSAPDSRAFFAYTIAPEVQITSPPGVSVSLDVTHVDVVWSGIDWDGTFSNRPVKYKYRLFRRGFGPEWDLAGINPDSLRRLYAPTFAGWDSTSSESTFVGYTNLASGADYLFAVVGFDEAGAYSARFALGRNMFRMHILEGLGVAGPRLLAAELDAPRPSPARAAAMLRLALPRAGPATLEIVDAAGRRMRTLVSGAVAAGWHEVRWDLADDAGRRVGPGVYLVRLRTEAGALTRKLLVVR